MIRDIPPLNGWWFLGVFWCSESTGSKNAYKALWLQLIRLKTKNSGMMNDSRIKF